MSIDDLRNASVKDLKSAASEKMHEAKAKVQGFSGEKIHEAKARLEGFAG